MKRIGIECESIEQDKYGIARIVLKTLEEIARRPELAKTHRFYLYFKSKIPDYSFLNSPVFVKRIVRVPLLPPSFSLYYYVFLSIRALFDRLNVMYFPNYMLPIIYLGKSLVLSVHDAYYEARNKNIGFRYRLAYRIFATWAARHASRLMAISEFGKRELAKVYHINPDRIFVNYLGVETSDVKGARPHGKDYILFAGQAFPRRHLKETLLAFEKIAPEFPDLDFIFVGTDKYSPPIINDLIEEINTRLDSPRITRRQNISDEELALLYKHAKAVTYISSKEAFGLPPLEALAQGSVPIVADNELSRELFDNHAFMVSEPLTVASIAKTLAEALTDAPVRERMLAAAPGVVNRLTWKSHTDRLLEALEKF